MSFKLMFEALSSLPAEEAIIAIRRAPRKQLSEVRIFDLLFADSREISTGVYLFFAPDDALLYVGKSQRFVERIPWHFALGEGSWMNHFLKYKRQHGNLASLEEAANAAREDTLLLLPMEPGHWNLGPQLERFLRMFAQPRFNALSANVRKRYKDVDLSRPLLDVLQQIQVTR